MYDYDLRRTASTAVIPRSSSSYTIRRVISMPDVTKYPSSSYYLTPRHKPHGIYRYGYNWDLWDDYWWNRRYYTSWPGWYYDYHYPRRRYYYDPPYSSAWWYSSGPYSYPRYSYRWYNTDYTDPVYYRRYSDLGLDRPWWRPYRPHLYDTSNTEHAVKLYKENKISYNSLNHYWLAPESWERRLWSTKSIWQDY